MARKPTYEELEQRVEELEVEVIKHKQAEKALQMSDSIVNASNEHMSLLDRNYIYKSVNDAYLRAHLKKRDDIVGYSVADILGQDVFEKGVKAYLDRCLSGKIIQYQAWFDFRGIGHRYMDVAYYPFYEKGETVGGVVVCSRDITDRKRAEEALRESESQKEAILDASIDRIRLVDTDMRIIWANKTTTRELNLAPKDLEDQPCYNILFDRDTPCVGCPTKKALESGQIEHSVMHQPISKGVEGETYWDNYSVPIKDESGDIVNLIQIARNITESKQAEEALRESEEFNRALFEYNPIETIFT